MTAVEPGEAAQSIEQGGSAAPPTTLRGAWIAGYTAAIAAVSEGTRPVIPYPE